MQVPLKVSRNKFKWWKWNCWEIKLSWKYGKWEKWRKWAGKFASRSKFNRQSTLGIRFFFHDISSPSHPCPRLSTRLSLFRLFCDLGLRKKMKLESMKFGASTDKVSRGRTGTVFRIGDNLGWVIFIPHTLSKMGKENGNYGDMVDLLDRLRFDWS